MKITDIPSKQPTPFGVNGARSEILATTPSGDNTASYDSGFPPVTMLLKSAGGKPPKGKNMNQILYELSNSARWAAAGGAYPFDASFSATIGGYPKGSRVLGTDGITTYLSVVDDNLSDPNSTSSSGWVNQTTKFLQTANNLSELSSSAATARANIAAAALAGSSSQVFNVGTATASNNAVTLAQLNTKLDTSALTAGDNGNGHWSKIGGNIFCRSIVSAPANAVFTWTFPLACPSAPLVLQSGFNLGSGASIWLTGVNSTNATFYNNGPQTNVDVFLFY